MSNSSPHVITLAVRLDRPVPETRALPLAQEWAEAAALDGGMASYGSEVPTLRVQGMVRPEDVLPEEDRDPLSWPQLLANTAQRLTTVLAKAGFRIVAWDAAEVLSEAEVNKRLEAMSFPDVVNASEFARMLDVVRQRVYQLEADRKAGRDKTGFPRPAIDGYWLRTMAETYAKKRATA